VGALGSDEMRDTRNSAGLQRLPPTSGPTLRRHGGKMKIGGSRRPKRRPKQTGLSLRRGGPSGWCFLGPATTVSGIRTSRRAPQNWRNNRGALVCESWSKKHRRHQAAKTRVCPNGRPATCSNRPCRGGRPAGGGREVYCLPTRSTHIRGGNNLGRRVRVGGRKGGYRVHLPKPRRFAGRHLWLRGRGDVSFPLALSITGPPRRGSIGSVAR